VRGIPAQRLLGSQAARGRVDPREVGSQCRWTISTRWFAIVIKAGQQAAPPKSKLCTTSASEPVAAPRQPVRR
jgi:hypothetical protein